MRQTRSRHYTAAERAQRSATMRAAWAAGQFAHRVPPIRGDAWTAAHRRRLAALVPEHTAAECAERLNAEFPGTPRTVTAVLLQATRMGLRPATGTYNARAIGHLCGVDGKTVGLWIARGWLTARQGAGPGGQWSIRAADLEQFLRAYPHVYDWQGMPPGRWRSLAEAVYRRDPLYPVPVAARVAGVSVAVLRSHLAKGWLQGWRRFEKGGAWNGRWLIARSELARFRYRRPELAGVSGRKRQGAA